MGDGGRAPPFLALALDGGDYSASRPERRVRGTDWIAGRVGSRAALDVVEKSRLPLTGIEPLK
jgi:hypothetical protein